MAFITEEPYRAQKRLQKLGSAFNAINVKSDVNSVEICGQRIVRPAGFSPSQWLDLWELMQ